jgi:hypothetical protein
MSGAILQFVNLLLPVLWATAGPAFVVMLTATANNLVKLYIPRALQIPLAGIVSAIAAGISGTDPVTGLEVGAALQGAMSLSPTKFLASAKTAVVPVLLGIMLLGVTACGKSVDQLVKTGQDLIGIVGSVYTDVKENVEAAKKLVTEPADPTKGK